MRFRSPLVPTLACTGCLLAAYVALAAPPDESVTATAIRLRRVDAQGQMGQYEARQSKTIELPAAQAHISDRDTMFEAVGLPEDIIKSLGGETADESRARQVLQVFADTGGNENTSAMFGSYKVQAGTLQFLPRFPLEPGVTYRVQLKPSASTSSILSVKFVIPRREIRPSTVVERIYPTSDELPENQLKFYLHFSAPMSVGQAYRHVRLLDAKGKLVEGAFLELTEELWDRSGQRFTLYFEPGRIKRGLAPREELGPPLEEGKRYTLVVDKAWPDATGSPLVKEMRKAFSVGPPDDTPPDENNWKIDLPSAGSHAELVVVFPEPLDHALLNRVLWVERGTGQNAQRVPGRVEVDRQETRWRFTPDEPWAASPKGGYHLVAEKFLEDRAGNSLGRKFEVDVFDKIDRHSDAGQARIRLAIRPAPGAKP
jgi:hypothetical protein